MQRKSQGFTLIEILLVIVLMTVLSAMVAPSFFQATASSVEGEARYMQKILRMASEQAQLTGHVLRCSVYREQLRFESVDSNGVWRLSADAIFQQSLPQAPVQVQQAHLYGDVQPGSEPVEGKKTPLARFYFWPDGRVSNGAIVLMDPASKERKKIHLGAGPGGIYVVKDVP